MAFLTHYTDPKKKVLQIVEIVCAIIAIVAAVFLIPPAIERHKIYQQAVALHEQGHERIHANDLEGARECFEAALRLDSKLEESYMELASLHYFEQEFEKERAMYHRGLKELPESTNLRFHSAESLFLSGAFQEAQAEAQRVVDIDPDYGPAVALIERCKEMIKHPEKRKYIHTLEQRKNERRSHVDH